MNLQIAMLVIALLLTPPMCVAGVPNEIPTKDTVERQIVVISDLHMGLGQNDNNQWQPTEDFRWTDALVGFLDYISKKGNENVDLVIAGDFLELWQPPEDIKCLGANPDLGCTISEMEQIIDRVIEAHHDDLSELARFAQQGKNHLYMIPGNHDAALVVEEIWKKLAVALEADKGHVSLVKGGVWISPDKRILIEHGHQIGSDVNRYKDWPNVLVTKDETDYLIRPWGELFVQKLFNAEEKTYPIIDNLSPEATGARYRMADRGLWKSSEDVARFIAFNLFETSVAQKASSLGRSQLGREYCSEVEVKELGYRLYTSALPIDDQFRKEIESDTPEARELQTALDNLVRELSREEIEDICALREGEGSGTLGGALEKAFVPRANVMKKHIKRRMDEYEDIEVFIYGHTHQLEEAWDLKISLDTSVKVLNSGAFQRLIDEEGYRDRVKTMRVKESGGLREIALDMLAPCYSAVFVPGVTDKAQEAETVIWHMANNGVGKVLSPGSRECK